MPDEPGGRALEGFDPTACVGPAVPTLGEFYVTHCEQVLAESPERWRRAFRRASETGGSDVRSAVEVAHETCNAALARGEFLAAKEWVKCLGALAVAAAEAPAASASALPSNTQHKVPREALDAKVTKILTERGPKTPLWVIAEETGWSEPTISRTEPWRVTQKQLKANRPPRTVLLGDEELKELADEQEADRAETERPMPRRARRRYRSA